MIDPRSITPESNMPPYEFLLRHKLDLSTIEAKMRALRSIGVPYSPDDVFSAMNTAKAQAKEIADDLRAGGAPIEDDVELVALIAYLQRLGKHQSPSQATPPAIAGSGSHPLGGSDVSND